MSGSMHREPGPDTLMVLSGNLRAGGVGRSRRETRFHDLMAVAGSLRPDVFAAQFSDLPGGCSGCSGWA